jgi:hypothetical protein
VTYWRVLDEFGEKDLEPLPARVHESYRFVLESAWGGKCVIRIEARQNELLDTIGIPLSEGVPDPHGMFVTFRLKQGEKISVDYWRYWIVAKSVGRDEKLESVETELSHRQWAVFAALLRTARFWELPQTKPRGGHDGAFWTLEGATEGRYHRVIRWSPDPEDGGESFVLPCQYLRDLARGLPVAKSSESRNSGEASNRGSKGDA